MDRSTNKRRRFRFSLRTLLIAMLVMGSGFGLLGMKLNQVHRQRRAVEAVRPNNGLVLYDYQVDANGRGVNNTNPPGPAWFRKLAGDDFFAHVVHVECNGGFTDFTGFPHVKQIFYIGGSLDFTNVKGLERVENLQLINVRVSNLSLLANLSGLKELNLHRTQVSDLSPLARLKNLRSLALSDTPVSDEEVEELQRALPNLEIRR